MSDSEKERIDALYLRGKQYDPRAYQDICAFASVIIEGHEEKDFKLRARIEKFCMSLVDHYGRN